jgi:alanyl-tRNA synthetase
MNWFKVREQTLERVSRVLKTPAEAVEERVTRLLERERELEREIEKLRTRLAQGSSGAETLKAQYKGLPVEIHVLDGADSQFLRQKGDALRKAKPDAIHIVYSKPLLLVTVENSKLGAAHAGNILKELASALGGRGGGQAQTAQGQLPGDISNPAQKIQEWVSRA